MKGKLSFGMGLSKKKMQRKKKSHISFNKAVKQIRKKINKNKSKDIHDLSKSGYLAAKKTFKNKTSSVPRVIPLPINGGLLPLIPIFSGLAALGSLAASASSVYKNVSDAKTAVETLKESKRHNLKTEPKILGNGMILKPYKKGYGLILNPHSKN
jgi:hypothetical protein